MIVDTQHLACLDVDRNVEAVNRVGVEILVGAQAQPAMGVGDHVALLAGITEIAARPAVYADAGHVGDAALATGFDKAQVGLHEALDIEQLLDLECGFRGRKMAARDDRLAGDRDDDHPNSRTVFVRDVDPGLAHQGLLAAGVVAPFRRRGLAQVEIAEQRAATEIGISLDDVHRQLDLIGAEWRQGLQIARRR